MLEKSLVERAIAARKKEGRTCGLCRRRMSNNAKGEAHRHCVRAARFTPLQPSEQGAPGPVPLSLRSPIEQTLRDAEESTVKRIAWAFGCAKKGSDLERQLHDALLVAVEREKAKG